MRRNVPSYGRMPSVTPVETPDTDAAQVYRQRWVRQDGQQARAFNVLALDEDMAQEMGGLRLTSHYSQNVMQWKLESSIRLERTTSTVIGVLMAEDPDETKLREETFMRRENDGEGEGYSTSAAEQNASGYDAMNARRR